MNGIRPILNLMALAYYRLALRQINPLHPDVPQIVMAINKLEAM